MGSVTLPSACYILFDKSSIPFYSTSNGYTNFNELILVFEAFKINFQVGITLSAIDSVCSIALLLNKTSQHPRNQAIAKLGTVPGTQWHNCR